MAVAAGNGANVTKSNNFVTKNESQNGSSSVTGSRTDSNSKTLQYISNVQRAFKPNSWRLSKAELYRCLDSCG